MPVNNCSNTTPNIKNHFLVAGASIYLLMANNDKLGKTHWITPYPLNGQNCTLYTFKLSVVYRNLLLMYPLPNITEKNRHLPAWYL